MFACCCWNVEVRITIRELLAFSILEILNVPYGLVLPAVAPQPNGLPLLEHLPRDPEQQPAHVDFELHGVTEFGEALPAPVLATVFNAGGFDEVAGLI